MSDTVRLRPGTSTVVETEEQSSQDGRSPTVHLKLKKPKSDKKVVWEEGTVDNEHMNKKKSKCCCIYKKQKFFGESSSDESDCDCTDNCRGHKKKCYRHEDDKSEDKKSEGDGEGATGGKT